MRPGYEIRTLEATPFEAVHAAMTEAFSDYRMDMSYMTRDVLWKRAVKNGMDLASSPGAFHGGRLVGLTLVGLGTWDGEPAAFDACTGIVKEHRGHGLTGRLFEAVLPGLRARGVKRFLLEVLRENESAIKAYERTGFRVTRPLACHQAEGEVPVAAASCSIRSVDREVLEEFRDDLDWTPSWENSLEAIHRIPDEVRLHGAFEEERCVGVVAYYPALRWIMTLAVKREARERGIGTALLGHALKQAGPGGRPVRANNVDPSDVAMAAVLRRCGFREFTTQYEMSYSIQ